jgi:hypothetical protein
MKYFIQNKKNVSLKTLLLTGLCFILPFFSCVAGINGSLSADGSAAVSVNMSLEPRMTVLIRSLSVAAGQPDGYILNGSAIAQSLSEAPGVALASLRNTAPAAVEGAVRISNVNDFLNAANGNRFIVFEQGAGGRCEININRVNGPLLLEMLSPEITDYLHALMAPLATGEDMSKSEYLELVASFYNKAISDEIAGSKIRASIEFPGPVTSVRGGIFSSRRAEFDIPLLDLFVLETPLSYEVSWN